MRLRALVELEELLEVNSIAGNSLRLVSCEMPCHVVQPGRKSCSA